MREVREIIQQAFELQRSGRVGDAQEIYERLLIHLDQPDPNVLMAYGSALADAGLKGLGAHLLRGAIETGFGEYAPAWSNLGLCYFFSGREEAARRCYEHALELDGNSPEALANLAGTYINKARAKDAELWARKAIAANPDHPQGHSHLALALLEQGRFEEAWPEFRWRWETPEMVKNKRPYKCPKWDGKIIHKLAIHGEQGVGDEILFASRINTAAAKCGWLAVECMERLIPLFQRTWPYVKFYPTHERLIEEFGEPDAHCALGDLFELCGLPDGKPYLTKPPRGDNFAQRDILKVGLAWRGGTKRTNRKDRSSPLKEWAPILAVPGIEFVSVQYARDNTDDEAHEAELRQEVTSRSVDEAAYAIAGCDLVISVCQTAVHLAGAMGIACWVLTPKKCAWRYSGEDEKCRWYDSVKLYRQDDSESWEPVIRRIADDLRSFHG